MIKLLESKVIEDLLNQEEVKEFLDLHQKVFPAKSETDDDGNITRRVTLHFDNPTMEKIAERNGLKVHNKFVTINTINPAELHSGTGVGPYPYMLMIPLQVTPTTAQPTTIAMNQHVEEFGQHDWYPDNESIQGVSGLTEGTFDVEEYEKEFAHVEEGKLDGLSIKEVFHWKVGDALLKDSRLLAMAGAFEENERKIYIISNVDNI